MFYISIIKRRWYEPESSIPKTHSIYPPFEAKGIDEKTSRFAKTKVTEYICNTKQNYYLERRLFG